MSDGPDALGRGDEELERELEPVFADLRSAFVRPAPPEVAADHLAKMTAAACETASTSAAPARSRRRTDAVEHSWRRKVAIAAAAVAAALFGVGGLGYAGALPGPVQDVVASVVEPFGLDLPRSDDPSSDDPGTSGRDGGTGGGSDSREAPGRSGDTPGLSGETPANGAEPPGQAGTTPGRSGENPGNSGDAPGQGGAGNPNAGPGNNNAGGNGEGNNANPNAPGQNK